LTYIQRIKRTIYALKHLYYVNEIYLKVYGFNDWLNYPTIRRHDLDKIWSIFIGTYNEQIQIEHRNTKSHHIATLFFNESPIINNIKEMICDWQSGPYKLKNTNMDAKSFLEFYKKTYNKDWSKIPESTRLIIEQEIKQVHIKYKYPKNIIFR